MTESKNLSFIRCKKKFFEVSKEERKVRAEHERLLQIHIERSIDLGHSEAIYTVPPILVGPFPLYDVDVITLWLIKKCRQENFKVRLLSDQPPTISVSGWETNNWLNEHGPEESFITPQPTKAVPKPTLKTNTRQISTEQASAMAQSGELTKRLRKTCQSFGK